MSAFVGMFVMLLQLLCLQLAKYYKEKKISLPNCVNVGVISFWQRETELPSHTVPLSLEPLWCQSYWWMACANAAAALWILAGSVFKWSLGWKDRENRSACVCLCVSVCYSEEHSKGWKDEKKMNTFLPLILRCNKKMPRWMNIDKMRNFVERWGPFATLISSYLRGGSLSHTVKTSPEITGSLL